ncbi:MAG: hypothetical protein PHH11_08360 [Methylomonas sp.]|nr:hypothetical protein [Methylomonas sp.]
MVFLSSKGKTLIERKVCQSFSGQDYRGWRADLEFISVNLVDLRVLLNQASWLI